MITGLLLICFSVFIVLPAPKTKKITHTLAASTSRPQNFPSNSINQIYLNQSIIFHGPTDKKEIALTFDADMTPGMLKRLQKGSVKSWYNQDVINTLIDTQTPATLFLAGMWIEAYPEVTQTLANDPLFQLANHSYSHPAFSAPCYNLPTITQNQIIPEIERTQKLLKQYTGKDNLFFRFPGGCYDQTDLKIVKGLGITPIQWDSEGVDSFNNNTQNIVSNLLKYTHNGSIIVLHMHGGPNAPKTADAIKIFIPKARELGFKFVKLSDLLQ